MINGSAIGSITSKAAQAGLRSFFTILAILAVSIISLCIAQRLKGISCTSYHAFIKSFTVTKVMLVLTYVFSYCFVFAASILLNGVGIAYSDNTCQAAILLCIVLYAMTKLTLYLFLVERVHLVREPNQLRGRSLLYRFNFCLLIGFGIVFGLMVGYRKAIVKGVDVARTCYIGLDTPASVSLLLYDFLMNLYLTILFVQPLWRPNLSHHSRNLRRLAKRTCIGCVLSLTITTINLVTLSVFHGEELGAICLACCTTDTTLNAVILFWVTSPHISETSESKVAGPFRPSERAEEMISQPGSSSGPGPHSAKKSDSGSTAFESHFGDVNSHPSFAVAMEGQIGQNHATLNGEIGESLIGTESRKGRNAKTVGATTGLINQTVDADLLRLESTMEPE